MEALAFTMANASAAAEDDGHQAHIRHQHAAPPPPPPPPASVVAAVLLVLVLAPAILIGNSLVLAAICRFQRLRTPSNYLVLSLAAADLGVGVYLPVGVYLELDGGSPAPVCLLSYAVPITLGCVSVLMMVAIAVDRFMSLSRPLRYNNLITHTAMERYIAVFWLYATLVGVSPLSLHWLAGTPPAHASTHCSFGRLVPRPIQLFMFCAVYGPSACVLVACYVYIYVVARGHARAISEVRHSLQHPSGSTQPRYGLALATTTGMFLALWMPFQVCMLLDVFVDTQLLRHHRLVVYLALAVLSSSAFNPWIYGYRNAELRFAVQKVVADLLMVFGIHLRSRQLEDAHAVAPSVAATAGDVGSCLQAPALPSDSGARQRALRREFYSWNPDDEDEDEDYDDDDDDIDFLLVPMARPVVLSVDDVRADRGRRLCQCRSYSARSATLRPQAIGLTASGRSLNGVPTNICNNNNNINVIECPKVVRKARSQPSKCNRPGLRGSRSMVESFAALKSGTDVWILKGKNLVINGASVV